MIRERDVVEARRLAVECKHATEAEGSALCLTVVSASQVFIG